MLKYSLNQVKCFLSSTTSTIEFNGCPPYDRKTIRYQTKFCNQILYANCLKAIQRIGREGRLTLTVFSPLAKILICYDLSSCTASLVLASTKLYCLVIDAVVCGELAQSCHVT